jgi:hypothetical protein
MLDAETTESLFVCADCGAREPSVTVDYGPLGYPVCPACGASTRPTEQRETEEGER